MYRNSIDYHICDISDTFPAWMETLTADNRASCSFKFLVTVDSRCRHYAVIMGLSRLIIDVGCTHTHGWLHDSVHITSLLCDVPSCFSLLFFPFLSLRFLSLRIYTVHSFLTSSICLCVFFHYSFFPLSYCLAFNSFCHVLLLDLYFPL